MHIEIYFSAAALCLFANTSIALSTDQPSDLMRQRRQEFDPFAVDDDDISLGDSSEDALLDMDMDMGTNEIPLLDDTDSPALLEDAGSIDAMTGLEGLGDTGNTGDLGDYDPFSSPPQVDAEVPTVDNALDSMAGMSMSNPSEPDTGGNAFDPFGSASKPNTGGGDAFDPFGGSSGASGGNADPYYQAPVVDTGNSNSMNYENNFNGNAAPAPNPPGAGSKTKVQAARKGALVDINAAIQSLVKMKGMAEERSTGAKGTLSADEQSINGLAEYIAAEPKAVINEGQLMKNGDKLTNKCGYESDGNIVLYHSAGGIPIWSSNTADPNQGKKGWSMKMVRGDLKLYPFNIKRKTRRPAKWSTRTKGRGNKGVLTKDGRFVIANPTGHVLALLGVSPKTPCKVP